MKTCVIIPAFNEEETIGTVVKSVKAYVPDVLVINDGSTDKTEEQAKQNGAEVLTHKTNTGKGKALRDGFGCVLKKGFDAVITMDADGQHAPKDIPNLIKAGESSDAGIVVGNRMGKPQGMPFLRIATNKFMSFLISRSCRQKIADTQCGYRLIKCSVLRAIAIQSANYEIESEVLIKASQQGYKIKSVPIKSVYAGQKSLINPFTDTIRFFKMLFKVTKK